MTKFLYFNLRCLNAYDKSLSDPWFDLMMVNFFPSHIQSRVHTVSAPIPLADTICPLPTVTGNDTTFSQVFDSIAEDFCRSAKNHTKTIYVCWSGGIDSTSILVSLLKVASEDVLSRLVVLYNATSIAENPYFYYQFIDNKLATQNIDLFRVTQDNYQHLILIDGEGGNQCVGSTVIEKMLYTRKNSELTENWRSTDIRQYFQSNNLAATTAAVDLLAESIKHCPIEIDTVYDLLWWFNFNFKFDDAILRKVLHYTKDLTASQTKEFYNNNLFRFFNHVTIQEWSMRSLRHRAALANLDPRLDQKKYIREFDKNDIWFYNKRERASTTASYEATKDSPVIALDCNFNKYSLSNRDHRLQLGKLLNRI